MLVWDLIRTCLKRWYIIVLGFALVGAGGFWVYQNTPVSYEVTGSVVLIPPRDSVLVGDNPYLYLGGLEQALGVLSVRMMSSEVMDPLSERFPDTEYTLGKDITTTGPIMSITIVGSDEIHTLEALTNVIELVPQQMASLQDSLDVPEGSRITTQTLAADVKPEVLTKERTRMVAMVGAAGLTAVLLFTALFDRMITFIRNRKKSRGPKNSSGIRAARAENISKNDSEPPTAQKLEFDQPVETLEPLAQSSALANDGR